MTIQSIGGLASVADKALTSARPSKEPTESSFSAILDQLHASFIEPIKAGEAAATAAMTGKMPVQDAILKVMEAERALQTGIAVRDKFVGAYQEIMRMNI